jgi:group II intron reverse transcriptase/maturase
MEGTLGPKEISTKLSQIAELAKKAPNMVFTTLSHHIDEPFLHEAFELTRKDGAVGVDGQTAAQYRENLSSNLRDLLERFKAGTYKAPPVKRAFVPKAGGSLRPIGIPTFEDKLLQRAVVMILEAIYEQDFSPNSYGFRKGRSTHQALEKLWKTSMNLNTEGVWLIDADIQDFFGTLKHDILRGFLDQRVRDGVIRRTLHKWLKAGVMEEEIIYHPETGTPQGGVVSPLLANIYLHEVLDKWFEQEVKPLMKGGCELIRYADDFVIVFALESDARRVLEVLPKRFGKYGLTLHPTKTKLIDFRKPPNGGSSSFDFLNFTHYWAKSRKGKWWVSRKTAKSRLKRAIQVIDEWCRSNRHLTMTEQHVALSRKLHGHYNYFGITGNGRGLEKFLAATIYCWYRWLKRRSQRTGVRYAEFASFQLAHPLPKPRVVHSALRSR